MEKTVTAQHPLGLEKSPEDAPDCIKQVTVLDVQWTNCPIAVEDDVRQLWQDMELGNDNYFCTYSKRDDSEQFSEEYPTLYAYLEERGVEECWIHWWW